MSVERSRGKQRRNMPDSFLAGLINQFPALGVLRPAKRQVECSNRRSTYCYTWFEAFSVFNFTTWKWRNMTIKIAVATDKAPPPLPFFSQAVKCNGMIYCSGNIGMDPETKQMVKGGVGEWTVGTVPFTFLKKGISYRICWILEFSSPVTAGASDL